VILTADSVLTDARLTSVCVHDFHDSVVKTRTIIFLDRLRSCNCSCVDDRCSSKELTELIGVEASLDHWTTLGEEFLNELRL
jgi:hypothetical protein